MDDINKYTVDLDDGRTATCIRGDRIDYVDGVFEAGIVENLPPETHYLRIEKGDDLKVIFLRQDEFFAIQLVMSSVNFSFEMLDKAD